MSSTKLLPTEAQTVAESTRAKIDDGSLRAFAETNARQSQAQAPELRQSVIVELAMQAAAKPQGWQSASQAFDWPKPPAGAAKKSVGALPLTEHAQALNDLQVQLRRVVGDQEKMVRLNAAEAFALEVTPEQLRAICELPLVGAVRPNRTHRVVKPASA